MTKPCEDRVNNHLASRIDDLRRLWRAYGQGIDSIEEIGSFSDYGLYFDYVLANTFRDQAEGYFRYQLSTGGPGDEFRFYMDVDKTLHRIEYWFLDWWDGAFRILTGYDYELMAEIFGYFNAMDMVQNALDQAREEKNERV